MLTVIEPLRLEWESVQAAVSACLADSDPKAALAALHAFHRRLCTVRVLDPACGSGNFLYVTLEHLKRLEAEVLGLLASLGETERSLDLQGHTVHPAQFLGLELNPRAAVLAELCLWIGYLRWHLRTHGKAALAEPIISKFHTIENRDAVLACDRIEPRRDAEGKYVTQWDGHTLKLHSVTGEAVPDEAARQLVYTYSNPRPATWPEADFIVGNPPFIGPARMRDALGDGYVETLRALYPELPESVDFVMFWWHKAARLVREGKAERFGFITTNSLRQTFNRRVLEAHLECDTRRTTLDTRLPPTAHCQLVFAIPDHPWVENADGAAVRIAMTVADRQQRNATATLQTVIAETEGAEGSIDVTLATRFGTINTDLTIGADVASAVALKANEGISSRGHELGSDGFIVTREEAAALGLGRIPGLERHIREYRNGRDLTSQSRDVMVIDLFSLGEIEVRDRFPEVYQWLYERVKPARAQNRDPRLREYWWLHRRSREDWRLMLDGLPRYIATVETAKHRFFQFLDASVLPDNKLICIAHDDAFVLGVLSSRIHVTWVLAAGSTLEDRPVYVKTTCFETFPFPNATEDQKARIRDLAERLDAHRQRQLTLHPTLTMTEMYNVLDVVRDLSKRPASLDPLPEQIPSSGGTTSVSSAAGVAPGPPFDSMAEHFPSSGGTTSVSSAAGVAPGPSQIPLSPKQRTIHEQGLITVLRQLHDELDAAVAEAYGWGREVLKCGSGEVLKCESGEVLKLTEDEILERLVALNRARADEEACGQIRYLRPTYQQPTAAPTQTDLTLPLSVLAPTTPALPHSRTHELLLLPWPETLADQIALVRGVITQTAWQPTDTIKTLARHFSGVRAPTIQRLVDALAALGQVG